MTEEGGSHPRSSADTTCTLIPEDCHFQIAGSDLQRNLSGGQERKRQVAGEFQTFLQRSSPLFCCTEPLWQEGPPDQVRSRAQVQLQVQSQMGRTKHWVLMWSMEPDPAPADLAPVDNSRAVHGLCSPPGSSDLHEPRPFLSPAGPSPCASSGSAEMIPA